MRTTKEDYERFKKEFLRLQKLLGLTDWGVSFYRSKTDDCYCYLNFDVDDAVVGVNYSSGCVGIPWKEPKEVAAHEIGHLVVARLSNLARCRYSVTEDIIYEETERIARRLESVLTAKTIQSCW